MSTEYTLPNIHPGEILREEFMEPLSLTAYRVAKDIGVPVNRIDAIIKGVRAITADTALRLGAFFGISPEFWMNLQSHYDLMEIRRSGNATRITPYAGRVAPMQRTVRIETK